jgi:DNA-binding NtrC family response regulator
VGDLKVLGHFFGSLTDARQANRLWERAVAGYQEGIIVCDASGGVVFANAKAASHLGADRRELEGRHASSFAGGTLLERGMIMEVVSRERPLAGKALCPRSGKSLFMSGWPVKGHDGALSLAVFTLRDLAAQAFDEEASASERELVSAFRDEATGRTAPSPAAETFSRKSSVMQRALEQAARLSRSGAGRVLVLGEPGSGKRAVARFIHESSHRQQEPFVRVSCSGRDAAGLSEELFGTGEGSGRVAGVIEAAGRGTVYLEDAHTLPLELLERLAALVLKNEGQRPAPEPDDADTGDDEGSSRQCSQEATLVFSSSADTGTLVSDGLFPGSLHEALAPFTVAVPPLRSRREDIVEIARGEVTRLNRRYGLARYLDPAGADTLSSYDFPGNVRELKCAVHQAVLFSGAPNIGPSIARIFRPDEGGASSPVRKAGVLGDDDRLPNFQTVKASGLNPILDGMEKMLLVEAVQHCRSTREMAYFLGISQAGVSRKLKKFDLEAPGKNNRKV